MARVRTTRGIYSFGDIATMIHDGEDKSKILKLIQNMESNDCYASIEDRKDPEYGLWDVTTSAVTDDGITVEAYTEPSGNGFLMILSVDLGRRVKLLRYRARPGEKRSKPDIDFKRLSFIDWQL